MAVWFVSKAFSWEAQDVHGSTEDALRQKGIKFYEFYRNEDGDYVCDDKLPFTYDDRDGPQFTYCYEGPVILRGPIKFVNSMLRKYPSVNFVTHFKDGFNCTEYLSNYPKEWFLNSDAYFTTFGLLRNSKITKPCFIRPNSPFKSFTGFTLTSENFAVEMNSLEKISFLEPHDLILVSENKVIDSEFRYVICNKEVIGYSEYRWDGVLDIRRDTLFSNAEAIFHRLNGHKHLIIGNHESYGRKLPWESQMHYRELREAGDNKVILMHYPLEDWNGRFHGTYQFSWACSLISA